MTYRKYSKYSIENPEVYAMTQLKYVKQETGFLVRIFKKYGKVKKILDVGCGIGAHAKELADKGYECVGVDANPAMIRYAKGRYRGIEFHVQRMQNLRVWGKFDALICIGNIIAFNRSNKEVMQTFGNFNRHLRKGGLLILSTLNPISYIKNKNFRPAFVDKSEDRKRFGIKAVYNETINERKQTMTSTRTFYTLKGNRKVGSYTKESRLYFPQEMKFFLEQAGFKVIEFYSADSCEFTLRKTKLDKSELIVVAGKNA
jgi:2-polyprenyl-3-methyl-5-hydroxy-6-metoxy-1,4-benzoquinol methylase